MSNTNQSPLASVPVFNIPEIDTSKINPAGIGSDPEITANYKTLLDAQKKYADELEQRYAQPNWFKVAAAFAKPQLGGFLASLGSVGETLGEQRELERASAPTVAKMRAEIARGNIALTQGQKAAKIGEKAIAGGTLIDPVQAAEQALLTKGPSAMAEAGQNISNAQSSQIAQAMQSGLEYFQDVAQFGKNAVDATLAQYPHLRPKGMPNMPSITAPIGGASGGENIKGVPENKTSNLPLAKQIEAQSTEVATLQKEREEINKTLGQAAASAVPIFEVATNLYKAASNPALAGAFGIFENGDPLSIIGKGLESGSFPSVLADMRQYITQARLGTDEKKRAISDLQVMESNLADLQTKIQNNVINPTDVRTMFESKSVPGVKNTQDAFLRGIARIGSDSLAKYELKSSFDKALQDPKFSVQQWTSSPYFTSVQDNAKKRTQALISNPASVQMPKFMQSGLTGAYQFEGKKANRPDAKPTATPKTIPKTSDWLEEAKRRGLIKD